MYYQYNAHLLNQMCFLSKPNNRLPEVYYVIRHLNTKSDKRLIITTNVPASLVRTLSLLYLKRSYAY